MINKNIYIIALICTLAACSGQVEINKQTDKEITIFPDYTDVTIPVNIAPLNFKLVDYNNEEACVILKCGDTQLTTHAKKGIFDIPASKWKKLLKTAQGKEITATICIKDGNKWMGYKPFSIHVANEPIDSHLAYRLIEPGYTLWAEMGIYQRNLENFSEEPIIENKMTGQNCMNCHSFRMQSPDQMLFHMRGTYPATYIVGKDKIEKLNTKTPQTISALVYPSWHPSGKYIAFTTNDTKQIFHSNDPNRIEVFDNASDVLIYDVEKHELITSPLLYSKEVFETFPTFAPDGKTLYFCTADIQKMPDNYDKVKYSLCSIDFDPETRSFGSTVDTLYNGVRNDKSLSFPRVSPDGKYLLYTLSSYGNFSIWHKDADLYMINLATKEHYPLTRANSDDVESYHSWSNNSRWIVFSSRRIDGLYTRPYLAYIDDNGQAQKAFVLPQKSPDYYHKFMKSYNIPELITGKVNPNSFEISQTAKNNPGIDVKFFEDSRYPVATPVESMAH